MSSVALNANSSITFTPTKRAKRSAQAGSRRKTFDGPATSLRSFSSDEEVIEKEAAAAVAESQLSGSDIGIDEELGQTANIRDLFDDDEALEEDTLTSTLTSTTQWTPSSSSSRSQWA